MCCSKQQRILDSFLHEACDTTGRGARTGRFVQIIVLTAREEVNIEQVGLNIPVRRVKDKVQLGFDWYVRHVIVPVHYVTDIDNLLRQHVHDFLARQSTFLLVVELDKLEPHVPKLPRDADLVERPVLFRLLEELEADLPAGGCWTAGAVLRVPQNVAELVHVLANRLVEILT